MRHINKPEYTVDEIVKCCTASMRIKGRADLINAYNDAIPVLLEYGNEYKAALECGIVHTLSEHSDVAPGVGKTEMVSLYDNQFVNNKQPRTQYYDRIISSAWNHTCPYCAVRDVSTLDHFLPKSGFPKLAVNALNLVPSCSNCNTGKLAKVCTKAEDVPLHPYFDNVEGDEWLYARFSSQSITSIRFYVRHADSLMEKRLNSHMKSFGLFQLYQIKVGEESSCYIKLWNMLLEGGKESLVKTLYGTYESMRSCEINSWKTAFYRAMIEQIDEIISDGKIALL